MYHGCSSDEFNNFSGIINKNREETHGIAELVDDESCGNCSNSLAPSYLDQDIKDTWPHLSHDQASRANSHPLWLPEDHGAI